MKKFNYKIIRSDDPLDRWTWLYDDPGINNHMQLFNFRSVELYALDTAIIRLFQDKFIREIDD
jgi:hypothetical protein